MLYIVATPIGNLDDITVRARRVLEEADLILTEDTRHSGQMLKRLEITSKPLLSFHDHNEEQRIPQVLDWIREGKNIALISDCGTPLISDPGFKLVRALADNRLPYSAIPGPCAVINALVLSGFPTDRFLFLGFIPPKGKKRRQRLELIVNAEATAVMYESPFKLLKLLQSVRDIAGNRDCAVIREMTKIHEEVIRGPVEELISRLADRQIKGEIVVVVSKSGASENAEEDEPEE
jgi:16S rRNA (cytidine1402-2'-O)-methyltransferase